MGDAHYTVEIDTTEAKRKVMTLARLMRRTGLPTRLQERVHIAVMLLHITVLLAYMAVMWVR